MTEPHVDLDALADLLVGEGTDQQVEHLSRCSACAARLAELDQVQVPVAAALTALPPPPLPPGLADRLSAALDDAEPLPAVEPEAAGGLTAVPPPDEREELAVLGSSREASRTVTPLHRPRRTWLPAAAVTVLALSAGGLALSTLPRGGDDADTASTAGGARDTSAAESGSAGLVRNESGTDYAAEPDAFDRLLPAVLDGRAGSAGAATMSAPSASAELDADVNADAVQPASPPAEQLAASSALDRLRDPAALDACLSVLVPPGGSVAPLAVDFAAYDGQPALVVVLSSSEPDKVDVYVVGPDCAPGDDSTLFFTRADRPR